MSEPMAMNDLMVARALVWQDDQTAEALHGPMQALSYYKIFGYPTGLVDLIAHKDALKILRKLYFGGGAVAVSVADRNLLESAGSALEPQVSRMGRQPTWA